MDTLNNNILIHYSEFLLKNYTNVWYKIFKLNKDFMPYVMYNIYYTQALGIITKVINKNYRHRNLIALPFLVRINGYQDYLNIINRGKINTVKLFEPYNSNKDYRHAIYMAVKNNNEEVLEYLTPLSTNKDYLYAIRVAIKFNYIAIIEFLMKFNTNKDYVPLVYKAFKNRIYDALKILVAAVGPYDYGLLVSRASKHNDIKMLEIIMPYNTNKNFINAILNALGNKNYELARYFVSLDSDKNIYTNDRPVLEEIQRLEKLNPRYLRRI